jgi:AFG3 family protein
MSEKVGNLSFYDSSGQSDYSFTKPYSEKTAELIDSEIKSLIEEAYIKAKKVLKSHAEGHRILAERLLEKEVIFSEDLEEIFGPRTTVKRLTQDASIKKVEPVLVQKTESEKN